MDQQPDRRIDMIVVHCSDSPNDLDIGAKEIEEWHRIRAQKEPWRWFYDENKIPRYIGYHYVIRRNGVCEVARPANVIGNHAKGVNKNSLGICWIGKDEMTKDQQDSLVKAVSSLCVMHSLSDKDVYGHYQFASYKTCPNFNSERTFESIDSFRSRVEMAIREIK